MTSSLDEKAQRYTFPDADLAEQHRSPCLRTERPIRRFVPAILLLITLISLFRSTSAATLHNSLQKGLGHQRPPCPANEDHDLIPLEAHIMSKCPDARDCLQQLVLPAMANVSDKVNFKLSFIGTVDPGSDEVSCMHGPAECLGNLIILCAAKTYPDPKQYLGFTNCMIADYKDIPERDLVEACAMEYGIDFSTLNQCISDEGDGVDLLRASVERSRDAGVRKSCTVRLDGEFRCIRDGGEWSDCEHGSEPSNLIADIEELYRKRHRGL